MHDRQLLLPSNHSEISNRIAFPHSGCLKWICVQTKWDLAFNSWLIQQLNCSYAFKKGEIYRLEMAVKQTKSPQKVRVKKNNRALKHTHKHALFKVALVINWTVTLAGRVNGSSSLNLSLELKAQTHPRWKSGHIQWQVHWPRKHSITSTSLVIKIFSSNPHTKLLI